MFNNETGLHEKDEWAFDERALWLIDEAHTRLYIIPPPGVIAEIEGGPDDEVMDDLNEFCRDYGMPTEQDIADMGLVSVPSFLWRFTAEDGYYTA